MQFPEHLYHIYEGLNHHDPAYRLHSMRRLREAIDAGAIVPPQPVNDVNNHIHSIYSFSPYSPTKAVYMAYANGLGTAGIMDHDSVGGAREFIRAGEILGMATTIGIECRVDIAHTPIRDRLLNNPDQTNIMYITIHGIAHQHIDTVDDFFAPLRLMREKRNKEMVARINTVLGRHGLALDYDRDVGPISQRNAGGSVTERHISFALADKLIELTGGGQALVGFWETALGLPLHPNVQRLLAQEDNPYLRYDLLGAIKSDLIARFYVPASEECPPVEQLLDLAHRVGAIAAYPYLGDVGDSVTGDKKAQKFEDSYLDLLFDAITGLGFDAVSYMPTRNTIGQLSRLKEYCRRHHFFEISGEDINTPRQGFRCEKYGDPMFSNLIGSAWALIGHEKESSMDISRGMFSQQTIKKLPDLQERIAYFERIGRGIESGIAAN